MTMLAENLVFLTSVDPSLGTKKGRLPSTANSNTLIGRAENLIATSKGLLDAFDKTTIVTASNEKKLDFERDLENDCYRLETLLGVGRRRTENQVLNLVSTQGTADKEITIEAKDSGSPSRHWKEVTAPNEEIDRGESWATMASRANKRLRRLVKDIPAEL